LVHAILRFQGKGAHIATSNRSVWDSLTENPDGSVDVILSAPDLPWLASMTMSFSTFVTVLEPPELREMVHEWAGAVVEKYTLVE
jgi:predicted DNA-binding transcriptional regulator YafY